MQTRGFSSGCVFLHPVAVSVHFSSERLREIADRRARRKREAANTAHAAAMMTVITAWEEEQEERGGGL